MAYLLDLVLTAQLTTSPRGLPSPDSLTPEPQRIDERLKQPSWTQRLQEQQQLLNNTQQRRQQDRKNLENSIPPGGIDCHPLFPPAGLYPPGTDSVTCSRP